MLESCSFYATKSYFTSFGKGRSRKERALAKSFAHTSLYNGYICVSYNAIITCRPSKQAGVFPIPLRFHEFLQFAGLALDLQLSRRKATELTNVCML